MADSARIVDWALENARALSLEATRVTWTEEWLPGFFDYEVKIAVAGRTQVGRGTDRIEPTAFAKSVAEALERAAESRPGEHWARAAHPDFGQASRLAYLELLGIDRVLCHHFCKTRFQRLELDLLEPMLPVRALRTMAERHGLVLNLFELRPSSDARVVIATAWSKDPGAGVPGFVKGVGVDAAVEDAAAHAVIECMRNTVAVFIGRQKPEEPLNSLKRRGHPRWHFWMAQTADGKAFLEEHLLPLPGQTASLERENVSAAQASFEEVAVNGITRSPLFIVQARSDRLLRPQFGEFTADRGTMDRLRAFKGGPVDLETKVPHFYG